MTNIRIQHSECRRPSPTKHHHLCPMIRLIGSKGRVRDRLIELMPEHRTYAEPFVGTGTVLLGRSRSRVELINDLNGEIPNMMVTIRDNGKKLGRLLQQTPASQQIYNHFINLDPQGLGQLQRAFRFIYLNLNCYSGAGRIRSCFPMVRTTNRRYNATALGRLALKLQKRLSLVQIYNMPFGHFIKKVDYPDAFFFIDPPYPNCEKYYDAPFTPQDQESLASMLKQLKGKALVTLPDTPYVHRLYSFASDTRQIGMIYSASRIHRPRVKELVIAINYQFPQKQA